MWDKSIEEVFEKLKTSKSGLTEKMKFQKQKIKLYLKYLLNNLKAL